MGYLEAMNRNDILAIRAAIEPELEAAKRLEAQLAKNSSSTEVRAEVRALVAEAEHDLLAADRIIKWHDRRASEKAPPDDPAVGLPKSVGERLKDFLARHYGPFTVEEARADIKGRFNEDITASAVAQALRRMVGKEVKEVKKGTGPHPSYFQSADGVNVILIRMHLNDTNGAGLSEEQIGAVTGLTTEGVCRLLREHPDAFIQLADNRWRKR